MRPSQWVLAATAIAVLLLVGLSAGPTAGLEAYIGQDYDGRETELPLGEPAITLLEAQAIAAEAYPEAAISEVGLEHEDGVLVYEIKLSNDVEVVIDATTGAIVATEQDEEDGDRRQREAAMTGAPLLQPAISLEQARQIALAAQPGTSVHEVELEHEDGQLVYEIELSNEVEILIDATTGDILATEDEEE